MEDSRRDPILFSGSTTQEDAARPLRLTGPAVRWTVDEGTVNAVIASAVYAEGQRKGIWQKMLQAMSKGAAGTREGTIEAFLFQAMVDRLLEEFHSLDANYSNHQNS